MFTTYDFYEFINTAFWVSLLIILLIGWGIMAAIKAKWWLYVAWLVLVPAGYLALILPSPKEYRAAKERKQRYETGKALFEQRCKTAGEKIYKTVDNVDGIMLLKVVPEDNRSADEKAADPMRDNAALLASGGWEFIAEFLGFFYSEDGYKYVDYLDKNTNKIIRYSGKDLPLKEEQNPKNPARYAVDFQYNINPELRRYWIAGATIQIIDRQTNEIIAEKTIYAFETALGSRATARMPWNFAILCNKEQNLSRKFYEFIFKILTPPKSKLGASNVKH